MVNIFHRSWYSMNTRFELIVPSPVPGTESYMADNVFEILQQTERLLSRFAPDGPVAMLNNYAFQQAIKVSAELYEFIQQCCSYSERTHGYFDFTCGGFEAGVVAQDIKQTDNHRNTNQIVLEPGYIVRFGTPHIQLDFGAVGKGYALGKVVNFLNQQGVENAFLSFGESSLYALGNHPHGQGWMVGIRHLSDPQQNTLTIPCYNLAISTSGIQKAVSSDGKVSESFHIINPINGKPVHRRCTISVVCKSPVEAEVLSTALYAAPKENWGTIFDNFQNIHIYGVDYTDNNNFETFEHDITGKENN